MRVNKKFHLSYCTNIHPGNDWEETFRNLEQHLPVIRDEVSGGQPFGIGLRLSDLASRELNDGNRLNEFRDWLQANNLYVFTMNGFPYGNFHHERVKDQVHAPDWTSSERLEYTLRLFDQLDFLLPDQMEGSISTSPVSYKHWYPEQSEREKVFREGSLNLAKVALRLHAMENTSGKCLHLDIEPEPDGFLENTMEVLAFYRDFLLPAGVPLLSKELSVSENEAEWILLRHITLCYDTCHFALAYEEPAETFASLISAGIRIGKIQLSAALRILPNEETPEQIWETLQKFDEPVYLHQVTEQKEDGTVVTYPDLPVILSERNSFNELRAHFHVPVFLEEYPPLYSTQDQIVKTLKFLTDSPICRHLEVETYTWDVLPDDLKTGLDEMVSRELHWTLNEMKR